MARDHKAVNDQVLALVVKLGVTPEDNGTSQSLSEVARAKLGHYWRHRPVKYVPPGCIGDEPDASRFE